MSELPSRDFRKDLAIQLGFIERSCAAFDLGHTDEALRIATAARVLLHDTQHSTSLLTYLNAKNIQLLTTCVPFPGSPSHPSRATPIFAFGLGLIELGLSAPVYRPSLHESYYSGSLPALEWWNQVVWILSPELKVTRKHLILVAANKDGGAHIDDALTPEYTALMGTLAGFDTIPATNNEPRATQLVALRQIGYELLNSPELISLPKGTGSSMAA